MGQVKSFASEQNNMQQIIVKTCQTCWVKLFFHYFCGMDVWGGA